MIIKSIHEIFSSVLSTNMHLDEFTIDTVEQMFQSKFKNNKIINFLKTPFGNFILFTVTGIIVTKLKNRYQNEY